MTASKETCKALKWSH